MSLERLLLFLHYCYGMGKQNAFHLPLQMLRVFPFKNSTLNQSLPSPRESINQSCSIPDARELIIWQVVWVYSRSTDKPASITVTSYFMIVLLSCSSRPCYLPASFSSPIFKGHSKKKKKICLNFLS